MNQLSHTIKHDVAVAAPGVDPALHAFRLVCACTRWPRGADDLARVRQLAQTVGDPAALRAVALRHGVAALVADALRDAGVALPVGIERIARARAGAALAQLGETIALCDVLMRAGVPALTLKGVALAQRLHGTVALRESADIDLAVAPADVGAAWAALAAAGYAPLRPAMMLPPHRLRRYLHATKDSLHRRGEHGSIVELHWRLSDEAADAAIPPPPCWHRVAVGAGRVLPVLGDDALFAYLCSHGAAHLWARLKWLGDVGVLLRTAPDGGAAWWRQAQAGGDLRAVASALLLANALLGVALPKGFVAPRSIRLRLLVALSRRVLEAGGGAQELATTRWRGWAEFAAKLLVAPGGRQRQRIVSRLLVSGDDVAEVALPPRLFPLYAVLRIPLLIRRRRARSISRRDRSASS